MADSDGYIWSCQEVASALLRQHGIHEGLWVLTVQFGLAAGIIEEAPGQHVSVGVLPVRGIGLERVDVHTNLAVDAAVVNPAPRRRRRTRAATPTAVATAPVLP